MGGARIETGRWWILEEIEFVAPPAWAGRGLKPHEPLGGRVWIHVAPPAWAGRGLKQLSAQPLRVLPASPRPRGRGAD